MKNLTKALIAAQQAARAAPLDGINDHYGYRYTTSPTMCRIGKEALNAHGLTLIPLGLAVVPSTETTLVAIGKGTREAQELTVYDAHRDFILAHVSGEERAFSVEWPIDLQGGKRPRDKAVAASDTTLLSYVYRDLLQIGRLREGEVDAPPSNGAHAREQAKAERKQAQRARVESFAAATVPAPKPIQEEPILAEAYQDELEADGWDPELDRPLGEHTAVEDLPSGGPAFGPASTSGDDPEDHLERQSFLLALSLGCVAGDENSPGGSLITCHLPPDPGQDDLEAAGWDPELSEELAGLDARRPVPRVTVNQLSSMAAKHREIKGKAAKTMLCEAFEAVGVDVKAKAVPNGYQLRLWALTILLTPATAPF